MESRDTDGAVLLGLGNVLALRPESGQGALPETDALWEEARAFESLRAHFEAVAKQVKTEMAAIVRSLDHRYRYGQVGYVTRSPGGSACEPAPRDLRSELSR